jgi:hypothetical protein
LKEAIVNKDKEADILINIGHFPFDRDALEMAVKWEDEADPLRKHLYWRLLNILDPELMMQEEAANALTAFQSPVVAENINTHIDDSGMDIFSMKI